MIRIELLLQLLSELRFSLDVRREITAELACLLGSLEDKEKEEERGTEYSPCALRAAIRGKFNVLKATLPK